LAYAEVFSSVGIVLILAGVVIIAVAVFLLSVRGAGKGKVRGGGAVIIGPIPIIFGTDKKSLRTILVLSLVLTVLLLVVIIVQYLSLR
jgi:uncharacterized protein (TIGR00304 family)